MINSKSVKTVYIIIINIQSYPMIHTNASCKTNTNAPFFTVPKLFLE